MIIRITLRIQMLEIYDECDFHVFNKNIPNIGPCQGLDLQRCNRSRPEGFSADLDETVRKSMSATRILSMRIPDEENGIVRGLISCQRSFSQGSV